MMSAWQLVWHWVGWICPVPYELSSLPSACLLPAVDPPLAPYQLVYSGSLWMNCICTLSAPEVQKLLGLLTAVLQSCQGQMQQNHLSSLHWGTLFQGLFSPPLCLWHAWVTYPSSLPVKELCRQAQAHYKIRGKILWTEPPHPYCWYQQIQTKIFPGFLFFCHGNPYAKLLETFARH